jgi:hypothetical protein
VGPVLAKNVMAALDTALVLYRFRVLSSARASSLLRGRAAACVAREEASLWRLTVCEWRCYVWLYGIAASAGQISRHNAAALAHHRRFDVQI